jgi:DNA-binding HxlR family transcriptional regulator
MPEYGQFCPVAKSMEIIGEKWTMLILRELLLGTTRFSDFQRAISRISPTILSRRLKMLEEKGLVIRKRGSGKESLEYHLTPAGKELHQLLVQMAIWGMRWARSQLSDEELDIGFLMWDIRRNIKTEHLPSGQTVICFTFPDVPDQDGARKKMSWWYIIDGDEVDLCDEDHNKDVDIYITSDIRTMIEIWEGDRDLCKAIDDEDVTIVGELGLCRTMQKWFGLSPRAYVRPATEDPEGLSLQNG